MFFEHRPHVVRQPVVQCHPTCGIAEPLNAETDFGKGHDAHLEQVEGLRCIKANDTAIRSWPPQFRKNVGVEQPLAHNSTSRRQPQALRFDLDVAIWRRLHDGDRRRAGACAFEPAELLGR
jgi:hypothetical protein